MSRRIHANGTSDIRRQIRLTAEEAEEFDALAGYLETTFSDLVREAIKDKRESLIAAGKRPPRRLKESARS
jgi:hypothetical protein